MRKIKEIIIHCTATAEGMPVSVEKIRSYHIAHRGFSDIGYHFVIGLDGSVSQGRPVEIVGAHCIGHNSHSIGIAYVGGLDKETKAPKDTRTPAQKKALIDLCTRLIEQYNLTTSDIYPHNKFANKACPCFDIEELKNEIPLLF